MSAKVYVGNLSWNTTDDTLRDVRNLIYHANRHRPEFLLIFYI